MTTDTAASPRLSSSPSPLSTPETGFDAGPSYTVAPPPECMKAEELTPEDQAKLAASTSRRSGIFSVLHHSRSKQGKLDEDGEQNNSGEPRQQEDRSSDVTDTPDIRLDDGEIYSSALEEDYYDKDLYRWAVLYENQRGSVSHNWWYASRLTKTTTGRHGSLLHTILA